MINSTQAKKIIATSKPTIIVVVADFCPHCKELKPELAQLTLLALNYGVELYSMNVEKENEEFLTEHSFETLPYCLVFAGGEFKGGENANKEMLEQLIPVFGQVAKSA